MSTLEIFIRIVSGIALIVVNAIFVLTEFGLTRLRQFDKSEIEKDDKLQLGWEMTEELEIYLTSCQLGISATSIVLGVVFEPAITVLLEPVVSLFGASDELATTISIVVGLTIINLVHQVWGEQAPTYFGVEKPLKAIKIGSRFLYWWTKLLYPLIIFGDWLAKATLRQFGIQMTRSWVEEEQADGKEDKKQSDDARSSVRERIVDLLKNKSDLTTDRAEEVIKSFDIGEKPAKDIMIPMDEIVKLSATDTIQQIREKVRNGCHSRYPLFAEKDNEYLGNIYLPSLLIEYEDLENGNSTLKELVTGKMMRESSISISDLIDAFLDEKQELCLLQNNEEFIGLVTFTDACEAIFGQLKDPLD